MRRAAARFGLLLAVTGCAAEQPSETADSKILEVSEAIERTLTQSDFTAAAERHGFNCDAIADSEASCIWHVPDRPGLMDWIPCSRVSFMVELRASFIDGARQPEYAFQKIYTGC